MLALYDAPLRAPFPAGTTWWEDEDGRALRWDASRDRYRLVLYTHFRDTGRYVFTDVWIGSQDLHAADRSNQAAQEMIYRKIKLLQQRHWMSLCYDRGGYC